MSDEQTNRGAADRDSINVNEEQEVAYWTKELGVTELELRASVDKVGVSADKVREFLKGDK